MPVSSNNSGPFMVGDWRVDPELDRLSHGADSVSLRRQVMEVLVHLARHQGRLVTAEDLLDDVWAGKVVTTGTVYNAVAELRHVLDRGASGRTCIETIPKKGYRLLAPVTELDETAVAASAATSEARLPGGRRAVVLAAATAIALLAGGWLIVTDFGSSSRSGDAAPERPLRRFTVDVARNVRFDEGHFWATISADGGKVVFSGESDGDWRLFSRPIDDLRADPIRGSEDATHRYALSPDGEWIAFFDRNRLVKKLPIAGGVPVVLYDADGGVWSIAWGANDDIVLASVRYPGLMRVSASGGLLEELTFPEPGEVHKQASFSPDGDTLVYTVGERGTSMRSTDRVEALSLSTGRIRTLVAGASAQAIVDGYLFYFADDTLWAVEFDPDRLAVKGVPVPLADDVLYYGDAHYSVSRDGTLIYTQTTRFVDFDMVWVDAAGHEVPLDIAPRPYRWPRVSPDGQSIAFVVDSRDGADLWTHSMMTGRSTRLTFDESLETRPVWSPDGRQLFYSSNRVDDLFRVDVSGVNAIEQLTDSPSSQYPASVTPDGSVLFVYEISEHARLEDISLLRLAAEPVTEELLWTEFVEVWPTVSPDGRWLAYASDRGDNFDIYLQPWPEIDAGRWQVSVGGSVFFDWDGGGKRIYYAAPSGTMMAVGIETGSGVVIGEPEPLFDLGPYLYEPPYRFDWDPTRERFLMLKKRPDEELPVNRIVVVQNWPALVAAARVGSGNRDQAGRRDRARTGL